LREPPVTLIVLAKEPVAGRVKTRLCPPCSHAEAAELAAAALADTLEVVAATPAARRILAIDGRPPPGVPAGFEVIGQRGRGLDERLAATFDDVGGPALLVGMDTPQLTTDLLSAAVLELSTPGVDAVIGHTDDGGWWTIGLRRPDPRVFLGVPMSAPTTGAAQVDRLLSLGLHTTTLPILTDVDTFETAASVAAVAPDTRFARTLERLAVGFLG